MCLFVTVAYFWVITFKFALDNSNELLLAFDLYIDTLPTHALAYAPHRINVVPLADEMKAQPLLSRLALLGISQVRTMMLGICYDG